MYLCLAQVTLLLTIGKSNWVFDNCLFEYDQEEVDEDGGVHRRIRCLAGGLEPAALECDLRDLARMQRLLRFAQM